jgi:hypothetical protein
MNWNDTRISLVEFRFCPTRKQDRNRVAILPRCCGYIAACPTYATRKMAMTQEGYQGLFDLQEVHNE